MKRIVTVLFAMFFVVACSLVGGIVLTGSTLQTSSQSEETKKEDADSVVTPTATGNWSSYYASSYAGGSGTSSSPYLISTPEQLARMAYRVNNGYDLSSYYRLTNDIDISAHYWGPIGVVYTFKGQFIGDDYTIIGMNIGNANGNGSSIVQGFFGHVGSGAKISGFSLSQAYISWTASNSSSNSIYQGFVCADIRSGSIYDVRVVDSYMNMTISSFNYLYIGGICGFASQTRIERCCVSGSQIYGGSSSSQASSGTVGGIAGYFGGGNMYKCFFHGHIDVYCADEGGGIAGLAISYSSTKAYIWYCYFVDTGTAYLGSRWAGGLVGFHSYGCNVGCCWVDATVTANYNSNVSSSDKRIGPLIGMANGSISSDTSLLQNCFWYSSSSSTSFYGGNYGLTYYTYTNCKSYTSRDLPKSLSSTFYTSSTYMNGVSDWSSSYWGSGVSGYSFPLLNGSYKYFLSYSPASSRGTVEHSHTSIRASIYDTARRSERTKVGFIYGATITLYATPNSNYSFSYWNVGSNSTNPSANIGTSTSQKRIVRKSDLTIGQMFSAGADTCWYLGYFRGNPYTLYYNANGGSVSPSSKTIYYQEAYGELATPTRTGYSFDGWYTASSGGTKVTSSTVLTSAGNVNIYAHWSLIYYTLTVKAGTGISAVSADSASSNLSSSTTTTATQSLTYNSTTIIRAYVKPGYTFSGWTKTSGSPTLSDSTRPNALLTMPASSVTVTANATANYYPVSYDAQGGTNSSGSASSGAVTNISITNPYGYPFKQNAQGYYESTNYNINSSYSIAKVNFTASSSTVYVDYISYGESSYDYGIFSDLNSTLSFSYDADSTYKKSAKGEASSSMKTFSYSTTSGTTYSIYVKYRKDGSNNYYYDSLQFKLRNVSNLIVETPMEFVMDSSGYFASTNNGIANSYSIAKLNFTTTVANQSVRFNIINYGESSNDYGLLSKLDSTFAASYTADSSSAWSGSTKHSTSSVNYTYNVSNAGSHFIYIKYRKDGSVSNSPDSLRVRISNTTAARYNSTYGTLNSSTKSNYTLDGWYTGASSGTKISTSTTYNNTSGTTLYAHWTPVSITNTVHLRVINKDGTGGTSDSSLGGSVTIIRNVISGSSSSPSTTTQTASSASYAVHSGQAFNIVANPNTNYIFVGVSTSSSPSTAIKNPTSKVDTTTIYYPTTGTNYYVYFKQASGNILKYDGTDKYFYFEDGYYPQSEATVSASTLNSSAAANGETITYNNGAQVVSIPVYTYGADRYAKVTVGSQTKWFKFEPIRWRISDYGTELNERNVAKYTTLLKFANYSSYSTNFVAVSDLILGVGSMNSTRSVSEGTSVTSMPAYLHTQNFADECDLKASYTQSSKSIKVQSYSTYSQKNAVTETSTTYTSPLRIASLDELNSVGLGNKQARASDMVAFILGLDKNNVSYWTRDLSNLGSGVAISASGTQIRPWLDQLLGTRFSYNFNEGSAYDVEELYNTSTKSFNSGILNYLLQQVSGDASSSASNMTRVNELAKAKTTAATMRGYSVGKSSGDDITVTLGGLKWTVVYLSQDKSGNSILTLWLDDSKQELWTNRPSTEGAYYGFLDGAIYSDWSADWYKNNTAATYPSNMYGTSYISAVTLNNGGAYAISESSTATATQSVSNPFAMFTMSQYGLTNYIVTPERVAWQETGQNVKTQISDLPYKLPNDNWSRSESDTDFSSSDFNYAHKTSSDAWKNDYLWLPSLFETGDDDVSNGLWKTSTAQRILANTSTSSIGKVGSTSGNAYSNSWLRSGVHRGSNTGAYGLNPSGDGWSGTGVDNSRSVRPALHLNLTAAARGVATVSNILNENVGIYSIPERADVDSKMESADDEKSAVGQATADGSQNTVNTTSHSYLFDSNVSYNTITIPAGVTLDTYMLETGLDANKVVFEGDYLPTGESWSAVKPTVCDLIDKRKERRQMMIASFFLYI